MLEIIITSSLLILIITALRFLLRNKLSPIIIYSLWAVAAVRLLLPISVADTRLSVMNLFERPPVTEYAESEALPTLPQPALPNNSPEQSESQNQMQQAPETVWQETTSENEQPTLPKEENAASTAGVLQSEKSEFGAASAQIVLLAVWICGTLVVIGYTVFTNAKFYLELKKTRRLLRYSNNLPVYVVDGISSPCLFGFIHPCIYLNEFAVEDERRTDYIIMHEFTHYRHFDHIWSVVRVLCTAVYWFNPLVWLAAYLSRQDSELACDSAVMKNVGNEHRTDYGRALLDMAVICSKSSNIVLTSTTMSSGAKRIKERVVMICKNPKTVRWAAAVLAVAVVAALAVTFTGALVSSGKPVEIPSAEEINLEHLPDEIYCSIHNRGSAGRPYANEAYISTVRDMQYITNVLEKARQNPIDIADIPKKSWLRISLIIDNLASVDITNDGYVIEYRGVYDFSGFNAIVEPRGIVENKVSRYNLPYVWYYTPEPERNNSEYNFYSDYIEYDESKKGLADEDPNQYQYYSIAYRLPEEDSEFFIERLEQLAAEQQIYDQPGAGELEEVPPHTMTVQVCGEAGESSEIYTFGEVSGARLSHSLNICNWKSSGDDEPIDESKHIMRVIIDKPYEIVDLYSDGHIRLRSLNMVFEENYQERSDYQILQTLSPEEYPAFVEGRLADTFNTYIVEKSVIDGFVDAFNLAVASADCDAYPDLLSKRLFYYNYGSRERAYNIELAAQYIDGIVLQPGESFSFNEIVGERTAERGFVMASEPLTEGGGSEYGGGVNRTASVLFNAAICAGMEITEFTADDHCINPVLSYETDLPYFDVSVDGDSDLRFVNTRDCSVRITADCSFDILKVQFTGISDGVHYGMLCSEVGKVPYNTVFLPASEGEGTVSGILGRKFDVFREKYRGSEHMMEDYSSEYAFTVEYKPFSQIVYTDDLPVGYEYGVEYNTDELHKKHLPEDINELWNDPALKHLLKDVPIFENAVLESSEYYMEGVVSQVEDVSPNFGVAPEMDMLVLSLSGISRESLEEYKKQLTKAGFSYFADGDSMSNESCVVAYNAPAYGTGIQIEKFGNENIARIVIFAQRGGCYGINEPISKG